MAQKKSKHKHPRRITTTRHDDGTYSHEHHHDDGKSNLFAGTSHDLADVHQHIDDHFGGGGEQAEPQSEEAGETPEQENAEGGA